jgi:hypothetical protein
MRMIGDPGQHVSEIRFEIETVEFGAAKLAWSDDDARAHVTSKFLD